MKKNKYLCLFMLLFILSISTSTAQAQRVYAPELTGTSDVKYDNESLIYILRPSKIKDIKTSEKQVHIQLNDSAREYFYTLTSLNKGKKLTIKTEDGETIQEGIIRRGIDSGILISKEIKERNNLIKFTKRIKFGKKPLIIEKMPYHPNNKARFIHSNPQQKQDFEHKNKALQQMRQELVDQHKKEGQE